MNSRQVLIRPVVSEKSYALLAANKYTFRIHPDAHKIQVRQAVEELSDVAVLEVRTVTVKGKPKRRLRSSAAPNIKVPILRCTPSIHRT